VLDFRSLIDRMNKQKEEASEKRKPKAVTESVLKKRELK
jgi:hypothetical protein